VTRAIGSALVAVGALAALAAGGCSDDGVIHIHGRLLNADGSPVVGRDVTTYDLDLEADEGHPATTDAEGRYELSGRIPSYVSSLDHVVVYVNSREDYTIPALMLWVARTGDDTSVPDVRLWDDALAVTSTPEGGARVVWNAPPDGVGPVTLYAMQATPGSRGPISWSQPVADEAAEVPAEAIEDRFAVMELVAGNDAAFWSCDKPLCQIAYSHAVPKATQGLLTPLSRGASCEHLSFLHESAPLLGDAGGPCPLTDGLVSRDWYTPQVWTCGSMVCDAPRAVTVDLGAETDVSEVVLRNLGVSEGLAWELAVSSDDLVFRTVAHVDTSGDHDYILSKIAQTVSARYVRVSAPTSTIDRLDEVSVF
jgi:hypothetical protein